MEHGELHRKLVFDLPFEAFNCFIGRKSRHGIFSIQFLGEHPIILNDLPRSDNRTHLNPRFSIRDRKKGRDCAKKLGKGESDVGNITETFRRNPSGSQSRLVELASSQKRVLRGSERSGLRSVDSECRCRVIEPRNYSSWRALVVPDTWGRADLPKWPDGSVSPGSKSRAQAQQGSPGTWDARPFPRR